MKHKKRTGAQRTTKTERKPETAYPISIVGLGASAGGLEAVTSLLKHLPVDTGMGFVLVQHLDPKHDSALTEVLARATSMPVRMAADNASPIMCMSLRRTPI